MAAKDATLTRGPASGNVLFLANDDVAAFEVEAIATPPMTDTTGRTEFLFLTLPGEAVFEVELTATPSGSGGGDGLGPTVSNFTAAGTLANANAPISFDVTDVDPGIGLVLVSILFAGDTEPTLVHNGASFEGVYSAFSTKVAITDGFTFTLLRAGGWPANITNVWVYGVDSGGTVGALP